MKWFTSPARVAVVEAQLVAAVARAERAEAAEAYWRARAERLIDQALVRRGEITTPVMEATKPADAFAGAVQTVLGSIGRTSMALKSDTRP